MNDKEKLEAISEIIWKAGNAEMAVDQARYFYLKLVEKLKKILES